MGNHRDSSQATGGPLPEHQRPDSWEESQNTIATIEQPPEQPKQAAPWEVSSACAPRTSWTHQPRPGQPSTPTEVQQPAERSTAKHRPQRPRSQRETTHWPPGYPKPAASCLGCFCMACRRRRHVISRVPTLGLSGDLSLSDFLQMMRLGMCETSIHVPLQVMVESRNLDS